MLTQPDITVIIPAYNAAKTLPRSVQSVQAQTLINWELIIVDDGASDNTAEIAQTLANEDLRIRVIRQENAGPSTARNYGASFARADILAFLDADDFWAPKRLNGMLEAFTALSSAGVLFSRTRFLNAHTLRSGTLTPHLPHLTATDLMSENAVCSASNIVCRKTVFDCAGGFTKGLNYAEDQDLLLRIALKDKWQIRGVDAEWFFYQSTDTSQSSDLEAMRKGWLSMVAAAQKTFPEKAVKSVQYAYGPFHRQLARRALRMHQPLSALRYLIMALSRDPLLITRQPKRTLLTLAGAFLTLIPSLKLREFIAK